jgi:hypothetical protein
MTAGLLVEYTYRLLIALMRSDQICPCSKNLLVLLQLPFQVMDATILCELFPRVNYEILRKSSYLLGDDAPDEAAGGRDRRWMALATDR